MKNLIISDHAIDRYIQRIEKLKRKNAKIKMINLFNNSKFLFTDVSKEDNKIVKFYFNEYKNIIFVKKDNVIITTYRPEINFILLCHKFIYIEEKTKNKNLTFDIEEKNDLKLKRKILQDELRRIKSLENKISKCIKIKNNHIMKYGYKNKMKVD